MNPFRRRDMREQYLGNINHEAVQMRILLHKMHETLLGLKRLAEEERERRFQDE